MAGEAEVKEIDLYDANGVVQRKVMLNADNEVEIQDGTGNPIAKPEKTFVVPIPIPDSNQTGLDATTTGVKWTSNFKFKIDPSRVVSAVIRATWTASATDSVTAIEVYDETAATVLGSVSGNAGTDAEGAVSGFTAGNLITVRLNVTTASATTGATTDLVYAVLEITYR